jgi:hypothetical protein
VAAFGNPLPTTVDIMKKRTIADVESDICEPVTRQGEAIWLIPISHPNDNMVILDDQVSVGLKR